MRKLVSTAVSVLAVCAAIGWLAELTQLECRADEQDQIILPQDPSVGVGDDVASVTNYTNDDIESFLASFDSTPQCSEDKNSVTATEYSYTVGFYASAGSGSGEAKQKVATLWMRYQDDEKMTPEQKTQLIQEYREANYAGKGWIKTYDAKYYTGNIYSREGYKAPKKVANL